MGRECKAKTRAPKDSRPAIPPDNEIFRGKYPLTCGFAGLDIKDVGKKNKKAKKA